MGGSPGKVIATLPPEHQEGIRAHHQRSTHEIERLRELRQIAGKPQADIPTALDIRQLSISKIEKQVDMHMSTLRNFEAVGELERIVRPAAKLQNLAVGSEPIPAQPDDDVRESTKRQRRRKRSSFAD
jgi:predicted transcriptional regulator